MTLVITTGLDCHINALIPEIAERKVALAVASEIQLPKGANWLSQTDNLIKGFEGRDPKMYPFAALVRTHTTLTEPSLISDYYVAQCLTRGMRLGILEIQTTSDTASTLPFKYTLFSLGSNPLTKLCAPSDFFYQGSDAYLSRHDLYFAVTAIQLSQSPDNYTIELLTAGYDIQSQQSMHEQFRSRTNHYNLLRNQL